MWKPFFAGILVAVVVIVFGVAILGLGFNPSALPNPGRLETRVANMGKHWLIARYASRGSIKLPPATEETLAGSDMNFRGECANCHGMDGRTPSDIGNSMYPRVLDLGSPEVQQFSDAELFWIIQNGIRLSGMPGFAKTLTNEQIADMVVYVRQLGKSPNAQETGAGTQPAQ